MTHTDDERVLLYSITERQAKCIKMLVDALAGLMPLWDRDDVRDEWDEEFSQALAAIQEERRMRNNNAKFNTEL